MSKNLKTAISLLLTIGVLSSSVAVTAFAEDAAATTDAAAVTATAAPAEAAEATEAPAEAAEATAAPEATAEATTAPTEAPAAPVVEDAYYNEALGLVTAIGIVQAYEDGSVKPENSITRAEVATMILRMMGIDTMAAAYSNIFTDVDSSHWAANNIQTAYDMGIINGMGDGTFAPDAEVTYAQAVKMLVCALKYEQLAMNMGGYPSGYLTAASQKNIEITKNATGFEGTTPATRGVVIKMIYNTLNALYPTGAGLTGDGVKFTTEEGRTLASELLEVFSVEGIVTATHTTSIDSVADPAEDQVLIDGEVYFKGDFDADKYVGYKVKAYYYEHNESGIKDIIYVIPKTKQETLTIDAKDIDTITDIRSDNGKLTYFNNKASTKTKTVKCKAPTIIYNGKILSSSDIPNGVSIEDFINPEIGSITLNDYDNDGTFDVMFVESYKTYVVTSASDTVINAKYEVDAKKKIDVDVDDNEGLTVKIEKGGDEITAKKLKKWDILTVLESVNKTGDRIISIVASDKTVEGRVDSIDGVFGDPDYEFDSEDEWFVNVDGKKYEVDRTFAFSGDIKVGTEGIFHMDSLGRIAAVEGSSGSKLSSSEQYGWLVLARKTDSGDKEVKIIDQTGTAKTYSFANELTLYGPDQNAVNAAIGLFNDMTKSEQANYKDRWDIADLEDASWTKAVKLDVNSSDKDWENFLMAHDVISLNTLGTSYDATTKKYTAGAYQMKLIKYQVNAKGELKSIGMPILVTEDDYNREDDDRPVIVNRNLDKVYGGSNMIGNKYLMTNELIRFIVPEKIKNVNDTATYKVDKVPGSNYVGREGISETFAVAELDGNKPTLLIKYVGASSEAADWSYNSADDTQTMMISKIQYAYDEDEEEEVYKITGYANGNKVTYTTTATTSVSKCNATGGASGDTRTYATSHLWSAVSTEYNTLSKPTYDDFKDALHVGDIVGVKATGLKANTIVKFVDAENVAKSAKTGNIDINPIPSVMTCLTAGDMSGRDGFAAGIVDEIDSDELLTIMIRDGSNVAVDPGFYVDVYNTKTGKVEEGELVSDLQMYDDDSGEGDIIVVRIYRMNVREIFAIRVEK